MDTAEEKARFESWLEDPPLAVRHTFRGYPLALTVVEAAEAYREAWTSSEDNETLAQTRQDFADALDAWKAAQVRGS